MTSFPRHTTDPLTSLRDLVADRDCRFLAVCVRAASENARKILPVRLLAHDGSLTQAALSRGWSWMVESDFEGPACPPLGHVAEFFRDSASEPFRWRVRYRDPTPFLGPDESRGVLLFALWGIQELRAQDWIDGEATARALRGLTQHRDDAVRRESQLAYRLWSGVSDS